METALCRAPFFVVKIIPERRKGAGEGLAPAGCSECCFANCRGDHWSPACKAYCPANGRGDPHPCGN